MDEDEAERVLEWRRQLAEQAGLSYPEALTVAASDADIHDLLDLIGKGCDPLTAVLILT